MEAALRDAAAIEDAWNEANMGADVCHSFLTDNELQEVFSPSNLDET